MTNAIMLLLIAVIAIIFIAWIKLYSARDDNQIHLRKIGKEILIYNYLGEYIANISDRDFVSYLSIDLSIVVLFKIREISESYDYFISTLKDD